MKRIVCLFLTVIMILSMFSGCGGSASNKSPSNNSSNNQENNTANESQTIDVPDVNTNTVQPAEPPVDVDPVIPPVDEDPEKPFGPDLTEVQSNSLAMLNYLALVSKKIEHSKNNRIILEDIYNSLLNNTTPILDKNTSDYLQTLLSTIAAYRQIEIKRERLQYIHDLDKVNSIKTAIPSPIAVLSVIQSSNWRKLVTSVLFTAVSSYNNYQAANDSIEKQFMMDGWDLDDEQAENLHKSKTRMFKYMVDVVREYNIPEQYKNLTLNEVSVDKFVDAILNTNVNQKLQFLKSNKELYVSFGPYWLELAKCYYGIEDYGNCLSCLEKYKSIGSNIFRYDFQYAEFLPMAIVAAQSVYSSDVKAYEKIIGEFTDALNSPHQNRWELKFFAAQSYMDLYAKTKNEVSLKKAYDITKDNVNSLAKEQENINETYLKDLQTLKFKDSEIKYLSKSKLKAQQKELDKYNKALKEKRKTELPELYEPLIINCELLVALAEKLSIDTAEKNTISGILDGVFIVDPVSEKYSFKSYPNCSISLTEDEVVIPANLLSSTATVTAVINADYTSAITDFEPYKVERNGKDISSFMAHYESKKMRSINWNVGDTVTIIVSNGDYYKNAVFVYKVKEIKKGVFDVIKGILGSDKVIFECEG